MMDTKVVAEAAQALRRATNFDVVVAGAGPGGAGLATMLAKPGLTGLDAAPMRVLLVEAGARLAPQDNIVLVRREATRVLDKLGALKDVVKDPANTFGSTGYPETAVASVGRVSNSLRATADRAGVSSAYETTVAGVQELGSAPGDGLAVQLRHADGSLDTVRAAYLVDATGGRLGLLSPYKVNRDLHFVTARLEGFQSADTRFQHEVVGAKPGEPTAIFGFRHTLDGTSIFAQMPEGAAAPADAAASQKLMLSLADRAGLPTDTLVGGHSVTLHEGQSPSVVRGSVLGIGDTVSNPNPAEGRGISFALDDADSAAMAIAAAKNSPRSERAGILADYDTIVHAVRPPGHPPIGGIPVLEG